MGIPLAESDSTARRSPSLLRPTLPISLNHCDETLSIKSSIAAREQVESFGSVTESKISREFGEKTPTFSAKDTENKKDDERGKRKRRLPM